MPLVEEEKGGVLDRMARGGLAGKVTFEKRLEGIERVSQQ